MIRIKKIYINKVINKGHTFIALKFTNEGRYAVNIPKGGIITIDEKRRIKVIFDDEVVKTPKWFDKYIRSKLIKDLSVNDRRKFFNRKFYLMATEYGLVYCSKIRREE